MGNNFFLLLILLIFVAIGLHEDFVLTLDYPHRMVILEIAVE